MAGNGNEEIENYRINLIPDHKFEVEDNTTGTTYGILLRDQELVYEEEPPVEDFSFINGVQRRVRDIRRTWKTIQNYMTATRSTVYNDNNDVISEIFLLQIGVLPEQRQILYCRITRELFDLFEEVNAELHPQAGGRRRHKRRSTRRNKHKHHPLRRRKTRHHRKH